MSGGPQRIESISFSMVLMVSMDKSPLASAYGGQKYKYATYHIIRRHGCHLKIFQVRFAGKKIPGDRPVQGKNKCF